MRQRTLAHHQRANCLSLRLTVVLTVGLTAAGIAPNIAEAESAPRSVHQEMFVRIGGIDQWITIKGNDQENPVVLFLHGGPGDALSPYADAFFQGWERDFTLVQWDQRGAGRTYSKNGTSIESTLTIERMVQDEQIADHIIAIEKGRVMLEGSLDHLRQKFRRVNLVFDDPPPPEAFRRDGVDQVIVRGRTISILASRNVDEIAALGPLLAAKSVEVQCATSAQMGQFETAN